MLERIFRLSENQTTARTELLAGVTTFLTMAYIIVVQPAVLSGVMFGKPTGMTKSKMIEELKKMGLPTRPFFYPLSTMPAYAHYKTGNEKLNPVSYDLSTRGITLPASYSLTEQDVKKYCGAIKIILKKELKL